MNYRPYYEEPGITIYHGDCREILPCLDAVDLVLTDPPYAQETHTGAETSSPGKKLVTFDSMTAKDLQSIFSLIVIRRWLITFLDWRHAYDLSLVPPKGLRFVRLGIWDKPTYTPQFTGDRPATGWEAIAFFHPPTKMRWAGGGRRAVWTCHKENGEHPTQKPAKLIRQLMSLFSDHSETILDPFMGSGTTLRAAKDLGRKAIGIEIEEKYCEIAVKRLRQEVLIAG